VTFNRRHQNEVDAHVLEFRPVPDGTLLAADGGTARAFWRRLGPRIGRKASASLLTPRKQKAPFGA
jgi:hypothetical protein